MFGSCPFTIDADNNPFQNRPEDLSEHTRYLLRSVDNRGSEVASWKPKGEPHHVTLMGLPVFCWETIWVFCEGDEQETDWIMIKYAMTISNETVSICRIGKAPRNHETGDPFPFGEFRNHANNCPFLTAVNQEASRIISEGDFLELDDLEGPHFLLRTREPVKLMRCLAGAFTDTRSES